MFYVCRDHGELTLAEIAEMPGGTILRLGEGECVPNIPYPVPAELEVRDMLRIINMAKNLTEWQFEALSEYNEYHCTEILDWSEVASQYLGRFESPSHFAREYVGLTYGSSAVNLYEDYEGTLEAQVMDNAYAEYDIFYHNQTATYVFRLL